MNFYETLRNKVQRSAPDIASMPSPTTTTERRRNGDIVAQGERLVPRGSTVIEGTPRSFSPTVLEGVEPGDIVPVVSECFVPQEPELVLPSHTERRRDGGRELHGGYVQGSGLRWGEVSIRGGGKI